jgi:hypothetical protein
MNALLFLAAWVHGAPYDDAYIRSVQAGRPLVVGVSCAPPSGYHALGEPWLTVLVKDLEGYPSPCIVVSRPAGGSLHWVATLPATASQEDVAAALRQPEPPKIKWQPYSFAPVAPVRFSAFRGGGNC